MAFFLRSCLALLLLVTPGFADVPKVVTDIAPVQSLVAMVMRGLGTPKMIVPQGAAPHGAALRPSQARALQRADLVIWIGPGLTPRLNKPVKTLAEKARQLVLLDAPGTFLLEYRGTGEDTHDHDSTQHHDPHAWLDPENGVAWLRQIGNALAKSDPQNAARYRANMQAGQTEILAVQQELAIMLAPLKAVPYVTLHDAYQYFEARFDLSPIGSVTAGDASAPGPARLAALRAELPSKDAFCVFGAPQSDPGLLTAVMGGDDLKIIPLDPIGVHLDSGPKLYPALLLNMGRAFAGCVE